jgi:glyoxylase I family protein
MNQTSDIHKGEIDGIAPLLQLFDMPASLQFYRDLLGFTVDGSSGQGEDVDWVLLKLNDFTLMLNTAYEKSERPLTPESGRLAGHRDLTLYFGYPDIESLFHYLSGKGIAVSNPKITQYNWKAIYILDPDNYHICFHCPVNRA